MMKKIALIIGNGNYASSGVDNLPNAVLDAKRMAQNLLSRGFDTTLQTDLNASEMISAIDAYFEMINDSECFNVFYFTYCSLHEAK